MPELIHFRGSDEIIKSKNLDADVQITMGYVESVLYGSLYRRELTLLALKECDWRETDLSILEGRRYQYKGIKRGVAIEGSFSAYEFILEGLFRLQVGFDKGRIETGILMLTAQRSENSKLGSSLDLPKAEVQQLYPTISMPVAIAMFDLGSPDLLQEYSLKGGEELDPFRKIRRIRILKRYRRNSMSHGHDLEKEDRIRKPSHRTAAVTGNKAIESRKNPRHKS